MATLATLQTDLDRLKKARRNGIQRIRLDDRDIWYKTDQEQAVAIAGLENEIAAMTGSNKPRTIALRSDKGWL